MFTQPRPNEQDATCQIMLLFHLFLLIDWLIDFILESESLTKNIAMVTLHKSIFSQKKMTSVMLYYIHCWK